MAGDGNPRDLFDGPQSRTGDAAADRRARRLKSTRATERLLATIGEPETVDMACGVPKVPS